MAKRIVVQSPFLYCNMPAYHSDELMYSYLMRVAICNGFDSIDDYLKYMVCQGEEDKKFYNRRYMDFDCMKREADCLEFEDNLNWMISGTPFKGIAPLQSREQSQNRLKEYYNNSRMKITPGKVEKMVTTLRICPKCKEEEGDDWYYHTGLQMPFVCRCPIHCCRLLKANPAKGNVIASPFLEPIEEYPFDEYLSSFSLGFFEGDLKCTSDELVKAAMGRIKDASYEYRFAADVNPEKNGLLNMISAVSYRNLVEYMAPPPFAEFLVMLAYLFQNVEDLNESAFERSYEKDIFLEKVEGRFELLGEYRPDVVHVRCLNCGSTFFISPWAIIEKDTLCYECAA